MFVALGFFAACVAATGIFLVSIGWSHVRQEQRGPWSIRINTLLAGFGVLLSIVSWIYALMFVTPTGMVERLTDLNPVLITLLIGYTIPGVLGVYFLWSKQTGRHPTVTQ